MFAKFKSRALGALFAALMLLAAVFAFIGPARAVTVQVTLNNTTWTLLGSGPMVATTAGGSANVKQVIYQSAATTPSGTFGIPITLDAQNVLGFQGNIYAKTITNDGNAGTMVMNVALSGGSVASASISTAAAATIQLVPAIAGDLIYVNEYDLLSAGSTNVTFEYGTGTNCGTGTVALTGALPMLAGTNIFREAGIQPVLIVPFNNALCIVNSAAVQISGALSFSQF